MTTTVSQHVARAEHLLDVMSRDAHRSVVSPAEVAAVSARLARVHAAATCPTRIGMLALGAADPFPAMLGGSDLVIRPRQAPQACVTVIQPRIVARGGARIVGATVDYWSPAELATVRHQMLVEVARLADHDRVDVAALQDGLRPVCPSDAFWDLMSRWARQAWSSCASTLRYGIWDLMELRRAESNGAEVLGCRGLAAEWGAVQRALQMPYGPADVMRHGFPELPAGRSVSRSRLDGFRLGEQDLNRTLPLISQLTLEVEVPADTWQVGAHSDLDGVVFVSLPPTDRARPGIRDRCLIRAARSDLGVLVISAGRTEDPTRVHAELFDADLPAELETWCISDGSAGRPVDRVPQQRDNVPMTHVPQDQFPKMVNTYVTGAGVQWREHQVGAALQAMESEIRRIAARIRSGLRPQSTELPRQRVDLYDQLKQLATEVTSLVDDTAVAALADPDRPMRTGRTPRSRVTMEVVAHVYDWPEWTVLLTALDGAPIEVENPRGVPVTTEAFERPFQDAMVAARATADRITGAVLDDWIADCELRLAERSTQLAERLAPVRQRLIDQGRMEAVAALQQAMHPGWLRTALAATGRDALDPQAVREALPMPLGRALPWHPRFAAVDPLTEPARNVMRVFRFRREIARALTRAAEADLTACLHALVERLRTATGPMTGALPGGRAGIEEFLDAAFGTDQTADPEAVARTILGALSEHHQPWQPNSRIGGAT